MRIALVSQEYPPETAHGGIATQTELKARGLAARGHDVVVVSCSVDGRRSEGVQGGVRVVRIPDVGEPASEPDRWEARSAAVADELRRLAAERPLDVIDVPDYGAEGHAWLADRPRNDAAAVVAHVHGPLVMLAHSIGWPEPDSELYRRGTRLEAEALRRADAVYSSSACSAAWCTQRYGVAEPVRVLHAGVDLERFAPMGSPDPSPRIAFVGRVTVSKGADTLIAAALDLRRAFPGLRLDLMGRVDPAMADPLREVNAAAPGLLAIPGPVSRTDLPERLSRAWVLAAPSRYEGGPGFVLLEAMACGVPVVAGDAGGTGEAFRHGEQGLFVPPGDAAALAAALELLLADAGLRERMGAAGRAHVLATADTRRSVAAIEAFYRAAAARRSAGRTVAAPLR